MVEEGDAERAVSALMMVIAGLAEEIIEHVASAQPDALGARVARLLAIAASGTNIAAAADVAASLLERTRDAGL